MSAKRASAPAKPKTKGTVVPVRIPADLNDKISAASMSVHLTRADVIRLAVDRGIDVLLAQLAPASSAA